MCVCVCVCAHARACHKDMNVKQISFYFIKLYRQVS